MTPRIIILATLAMFATAGCSFVETTPEGEKVRVLALDEVKTCRKLGQTRVKVLDNLIGVARPPETVAEELRTEAGNSAGEMGGDTIVPTTDVVEGRQTFDIYKCIDPNAS